jgi:NADH-quinone oxidoreductase subunit J
MELGSIAFYVLSVLAIGGAVGLITARNPIYSLLFLVLNFFAIGGLFLTLNAEFLAVIQIIVYAGAIMVLFLFVVMLLNLNESSPEEFRYDWKRGSSFLLGAAFMAEMLYALTSIGQLRGGPKANFTLGKVEPIGKLLMTDYLFPFEMISVILLAALIGAIVIAKKTATTNTSKPTDLVKK